MSGQFHAGWPIRADDAMAFAREAKSGVKDVLQRELESIIEKRTAGLAVAFRAYGRCALSAATWSSTLSGMTGTAPASLAC